MFQTTVAYDTARKEGRKPIFLAWITGKKARRVYGKLTPTEAETGSNLLMLWDGTYYTGQGVLFDGGGIPIYTRTARVLQFGGYSETLTPQRNDLIASLTQSELGSFQIVLDNTDSEFSQILGDDQGESFLGQDVVITQSFQGLTVADLQPISAGVVTEVRLTAKTLTLSCEPTIISSTSIQVINSEIAPDEDIRYVSQFGSYGSGDGEFDAPTGIVVNSSGDIYVVDTDNNRVQKFSSDGVFISKFGSYGSGNGEFDAPYGIALDSAGNIFVTDSANDRVQKFNSSGVYVSQFGTGGTGNGQFDSPRDIVIDAADNIFVLDTMNNRVQKFNPSGVYVSQFGSYGTGDGEFDAPCGMCFDSSYDFLIADTFNNRIQRFNSSGIFLSKWGTAGEGDGQFQYPYGIVVASFGKTYVVDRNNHRIQKFNSSGVYVSQIGCPGTGGGEFNSPYGIAVDSSDHIWVTDEEIGHEE